MKSNTTWNLLVAKALITASNSGALLLSACGEETAVQPAEVRAQVLVESPEEGFVTAESDVTLTFVVQDAAATGFRVFVGHEQVVETSEALAQNQRVSQTLSLAAGVHVIRVEILDAQGVADSQSITVVRVDERPELELLAPSNGLISESRSISVRFAVKNAPASGFRIFVGDAEVVTEERELAVGEEVSQSLTLASGVNTLRVVLVDALGEAASVERVVIVNEVEAPRAQLEIQEPTQASVSYSETVALSFAVRGVAASGYRITVNDEMREVLRPLVVDELVRETVSLKPGLNTVTVALFDAEGESSRQSLVLSYEELEAPLVRIETPAEGAIIFGERVQLTGEVLGPRALAAVMVRVGEGDAVAATLEGARFSAELALEVGTQTVHVVATDVEGAVGEASWSISRELDSQAPHVGLVFPRSQQAVKTLQALVRGTVSDNDGVASVALVLGETRVEATVDAGAFQALVPLKPGLNEVRVEAADFSGNIAELNSTIYSGERLSGGGAHGGAILNGQLYTWGRNNLGQTGLGFTSHESRANWCSRGLEGEAAVVCGVTSYTNLFNLCDTQHPGDTTASDACRARLSANRLSVCSSLGSQAPGNCVSGNSVNLINTCDTVFGIRSPAALSCQSTLVCDTLYEDAASVAHEACESVLASVPTVYPAPPPPYSAQPVEQGVIAGELVNLSERGIQFLSVSLNQNGSAAIDSQGRLWTWGDQAGGQGCLGDELTRDEPHLVPDFGAPGSKVVAVHRGYDQLVALRDDGSVWGCGANDLGQIGDGQVGGNRMVPTRVQGLPTDIVQVMSSAKSTYALTREGTVYAWGRNQYGNLGNGTVSASSAGHAVPQMVPDLTGVMVLANGRDHVVAAMADGSIKGWGLNASSQVGPFMGNQSSPVTMPEVKNAFAVYANGNQSFYLDEMGRLWGWGQNGTTANLGIPEEETQNMPNVPVFGLDQLLDVGIGALHGFGLRGDRVFAWGWSFHGSLGGGDATIHIWGYRTPIQVQFD